MRIGEVLGLRRRWVLVVVAVSSSVAAKRNPHFFFGFWGRRGKLKEKQKEK